MAALTEATVVLRIQRALRDPSTATFATADIHLEMLDSLHEVSEWVPNLVLSTVTTQEGVKSINIGAQTNLLYGENEMSFEQVEFPIDLDPQRKRNFSVQGSALHMDIDFVPTSGEDVRLTLRRPHDLFGSTSTLTPALEKIFIQHVAGKMGVEHAIDSIGGISIGGQRTSEQFEAWGTRQVEKAEKKLGHMRTARMAIEYRRDR
ncbi:hypothetical protein LCGC14_1632660 [marine sediment metagenome]|uniref:Uncharacterized protein n=1 Tax=marine sediment metagenome TaxID=412755 RepID=A0A0F9IPE5_9ZZZZ